MEIIEDFLHIVEKRYPKLIWFLVRFIVSTGLVLMMIFGASMLYIAFAPFIMLISGRSIACFLLWFMMPIPLFITWSANDIVKYIYSEYIDIKF